MARLAATILSALAALFFFSACVSKPSAETGEGGPLAYQRRIILVLERAGTYQPVAGAVVEIDALAPARLVSPAGGRGKTGPHGELELLFEAPADYDQAALKAGDLIADYAVKAVLRVKAPGRTVITVDLEDQETFARFGDPLYQGLNRDPDPSVVYYTVEIP